MNNKKTPDPATSVAHLYRQIRRIRRVEEVVIDLYPTDKIKSPVHLSIGQESVSVGVCAALAPTDIVFGTYRGHALYLAKGGSMNAMMAELYGKADGCARGKSGSMHLVDVGVGMMGTSAIVATSIPQAVGYAFAIKQRRAPTVVVCFFGEGAMDEGVFHESLNFAALKKLPVLFVCENNGYAIYSNVKDRMANHSICARSESYGIPAVRIEQGNAERIRAQTATDAAAIRSGSGPRFIEAMTCRWRDHVGPGEDRIHKYRPDAELDGWIAADEMKRLGELLGAEKRAAIDREVEDELATAIAFAEKSPYPADREIYDHVFHDT
jgi:pyruvate dehydrogenase E1 component alpha subunit